MHLLTRFFSQKNFLDAFISGKLYMNTLDYFWNNGFEEQKDIFEGVVCTVPVKDFNGFPMVFKQLRQVIIILELKDINFVMFFAFIKLILFWREDFFATILMMTCQNLESMWLL